MAGAMIASATATQVGRCPCTRTGVPHSFELPQCRIASSRQAVMATPVPSMRGSRRPGAAGARPLPGDGVPSGGCVRARHGGAAQGAGLLARGSLRFMAPLS